MRYIDRRPGTTVGAAAENLRRLRDTWTRLLDGTVTDAEEVDTLIAALRIIETRLVAQSRIATSQP